MLDCMKASVYDSSCRRHSASPYRIEAEELHPLRTKPRRYVSPLTKRCAAPCEEILTARIIHSTKTPHCIAANSLISLVTMLLRWRAPRRTSFACFAYMSCLPARRSQRASLWTVPVRSSNPYATGDTCPYPCCAVASCKRELDAARVVVFVLRCSYCSRHPWARSARTLLSNVANVHRRQCAVL